MCNELYDKRLSALEAGGVFILSADTNQLKYENELMTIKIKKTEDRPQFIFDDLLIGLIIILMASLLFIL